MGFGATSQAVTPLQAARLELGWKAAQTIRALQDAASVMGVSVATASSLKTMLSRWENGHDVPDATSQRLLCQVYGQSPDELGLAGTGLTVFAKQRITPPVGSEMVQYFRNVFAEHLRADNLMGPHHLVDVVRAQAELLGQMMPNAQGNVRLELLSLAHRYYEFAGWLYQDAGNPDQAMRFTDRSMDYALELDNPRDTSYVLMRKADIAADLDSPDRVIGLAGAALRDSKRISPRGKALVLRLQGRAYARLGNASECSRALESAYAEVMRSAEPDGLTDYCTPEYIDMEAANSLAKLGKFGDAIAKYERSLMAWPDNLRRDQGLCLARLGYTYAANEDIRNACATGDKAVAVVRSAPSSRTLSELQRLRVRLAPWRRDAEVSDLCNRIRGLFQPAA